MSYVDVVVRVNTEEHSFATSPEQARAMVENMIRRDPRYSRHAMDVVLPGDSVASRRIGLTSDTTEETGVTPHNIFEELNGS